MTFYGKSDIGKSRKENQDRIYMYKNKLNNVSYFIVADGMGGVKGGATAATIAVDTIHTYIDDTIDKIELERDKIKELIKSAIEKANKAVFDRAQNDKKLYGMGTTIIVTIIYGDRAYIGHVGDSRIYRIRNNIIRQLTKDHSYVQALLSQGSITKQEAQNHPQRNVLLKVVGCEEEVEPDLIVRGFIGDDIILMCSDGLTNMVSNKEIYNTIIENKENVQNACVKLIDDANENGGFDNISVVLISKD